MCQLKNLYRRSTPVLMSGAFKLVSILMLWGAIVPAVRSADTALADLPIPSSQETVPANVMLALSVEFPTALSHANFSQGNYGVTALAADATVDPYFEPTRKYLGYFDPTKCYKYNGTSADGYFYPTSTKQGNNFTCSAEWSGNYLNWATMSVVDLFRWAMTGGARDVDSPTDFSNATPIGRTILKKSWSNNQGATKNFPDKALLSSMVASYTPFSTSSSKNLVAVTRNKGISVEFSQSSSSTSYSATNTLVGLGSYQVRVLVCDGTDTSAHEYIDNNYCQKYQSESDKTKYVYKPVGLMQKNIKRMRFGAVSYLNLNNSTYGTDANLQAWDGGVLKAQIRDTSLEIAPTGAFYSNPFPSDMSGDADVSKTGAINYLNLFGYYAKSYKRYDNVSEMYAVALRYLLGPYGIGNVPEYSTVPSTQPGNIKDDFPVIKAWNDPMFAVGDGGSCQKQFIIGVGDTNTCCDSNLSGGNAPSDSTDSNGKTYSMTSSLVAGEKFAKQTAKQWLQKIPAYSSTYDYIAGLAYAANTSSLRDDFKDMRIKTFWLDALEFSTKKANNQYQKAAKYGAFNDFNGNGVPDNGEWNTLNQTYQGEVLPDAYFPASDPDRLLSGLSSAFSQINSLIGSGAGVSLDSSVISTASTTGLAFQTSYNSQYWSGDLKAFSVDATNGDLKTTFAWSAAAKLDAMAWDTARKVVTLAPDTNGKLIGVPFQWSSLSSGQKAALGSTDAEQKAVLNYLRGSTENQSTLTNHKAYRYRASILGDIVDSGALYVGPPNEVYSDGANPGYSTFKSDKAARKPVVYVGANDGMLHAFDAQAGGGGELFAVVPNAVFLGPDGNPSISGLKALTDNNYLHHNYVNGTPFSRDIDFKRAGKTETDTSVYDWHTLLVVGLGKGGRSYVALDITDPPDPATNTSAEATIASKVLWEFTYKDGVNDIGQAASEDMGFSYGRPFIVKTQKWGWVVIIAAGYNNNLGSSNQSTPGKGVIFVLNPLNGHVLQKITTTEGNAENPSGLAHVSGYVQDYSDMTMDQLYAGDLFGNLWRFDFTSKSADVPPPDKIAVLTAPKLGAQSQGDAQPITTEPLIEIAPDLVRYVFVGTGRLLHNNDRDTKLVTVLKPQTFYALRDGTITNPYSLSGPNKLPISAFPSKRENMVVVDNLLEGVTLDPDKPMGWLYDLPGSDGNFAEQVVINPQANEGVVSWIGTLINSDRCNPAGSSAVYAVKYGSAKSVLYQANDAGALTRVNSISSAPGLVGLKMVRYGATIRLVGSSSNTAPPGFIGSQVAGFGNPRVLNWRIIGQ